MIRKIGANKPAADEEEKQTADDPLFAETQVTDGALKLQRTGTGDVDVFNDFESSLAFGKIDLQVYL